MARTGPHNRTRSLQARSPVEVQVLRRGMRRSEQTQNEAGLSESQPRQDVRRGAGEDHSLSVKVAHQWEEVKEFDKSGHRIVKLRTRVRCPRCGTELVLESSGNIAAWDLRRLGLPEDCDEALVTNIHAV